MHLRNASLHIYDETTGAVLDVSRLRLDADELRPDGLNEFSAAFTARLRRSGTEVTMNDNAARSVSGKNFYAALALPEIRLFILNLGFFTLASKAIAVVIGFQVYQLTHSVAMVPV